jgi:hypothetical protein
MNADIKRLLKNWHNEINILIQAHYETAIKKKRMNYVVGIPLIMLEIIIASYMIFTITQDPSIKLKMIVGALVILAAILAALQTFLKYSEQAEDHRNAQARFRNLMISIDQVLALPPKEEHALVEWCDKFRERWNEVSIDAPVISKRLLKAKQITNQLEGQIVNNEQSTVKEAVVEEKPVFVGESDSI